MGEAREVMDRMTEAMMSQDFAALGEIYASDAVAVTPDQGEVRGREPIVQYLKQFIEAFPDLQYESLHAHERATRRSMRDLSSALTPSHSPCRMATHYRPPASRSVSGRSTS